MSEAAYKLEYWINKRNYSEEGLKSKLFQDLEKLDIELDVKEEADYYLVIIEGDKRNTDACHDHLNFDREEIFRAKDELGDELRSKAYPILAEIEIRLRRFITRAMIEVLDFNWWDRSTPKKIRKNVSRIEKQSGSKQAADQHQIEFTMFDDLIELVTGKYQKWTDTKNLTPADLADLLDDCETIEELKQELSQKRKLTSLWEDVFSYYFDDKEAWDKLEKKIQEIVIPIRHKVMHHRRIRIHNVRELEECRDELNWVIGTAKPELTKGELKDIANTFKVISKSNLFQIDPKVIQAIQRSAQIDPEIIKAITQTPLIDPDVIRGLMPKINLGIYGSNEDTDMDEGNERESNGEDDNEKDDEEDNSDDAGGKE